MSHLARLKWVLDSPYLIQAEGSPFKLARQPEPEDTRVVLEQAEQHLERFLSDCNSHFLGSYFEALWKFYLTYSPGHELLASNLQIHEGGKTLGELDFLLIDKKTNQAVHQEIAVKFYLGCNTGEVPQWVGPNAIDRLDLKMSHLKNKQLPFSSHPLAKKAIREQFGLERINSEVVLKGYLFHPLNATNLEVQPFINPAHASGHWCYASELFRQETELSPPGTSWFKMDKKDWMTNQLSQADISASPLNDEQLRDASAAIEEHNRAQLFCRLTQGTELPDHQSRLFVVPSSWPG